jgi:hypothetical protein
MRATAAALALLAVGCRPETRRPSAGVSTAASDSLELALVAPATVRLGDPVRFALRVGNPGTGPRDLYLRGRTITFDVEVTGADGAVVWRRLEGEIIPAILHLRTLAPGERVVRNAVWDQRTHSGVAAPAGAYTARGLLLVEGPPLATPPVEFRIVPR